MTRKGNKRLCTTPRAFSKRRFFVATVTHKDLLKRIEDSQPETGEITSKVILAKPFPRDDDDDDDDDKRRKRNEFLSLSCVILKGKL